MSNIEYKKFGESNRSDWEKLLGREISDKEVDCIANYIFFRRDLNEKPLSEVKPFLRSILLKRKLKLSLWLYLVLFLLVPIFTLDLPNLGGAIAAIILLCFIIQVIVICCI